MRLASCSTPSGVINSTASGHRRDLPLLLAGHLVRHTQDGDEQSHVGLDGRDHVPDGGALLAHEPEHAVARLGERREGLERVERCGQAPSMAFVLAGGPRRGGGCGGARDSASHRGSAASPGVIGSPRPNVEQVQAAGPACRARRRRVRASPPGPAPPPTRRSRRDGGAADRHAQRLEHVAWLGTGGLDHPAQRSSTVSASKGSAPPKGLARRRRFAGAPSRSITFRHAFSS